MPLPSGDQLDATRLASSSCHGVCESRPFIVRAHPAGGHRPDFRGWRPNGCAWCASMRSCPASGLAGGTARLPLGEAMTPSRLHPRNVMSAVRVLACIPLGLIALAAPASAQQATSAGQDVRSSARPSLPVAFGRAGGVKSSAALAPATSSTGADLLPLTPGGACEPGWLPTFERPSWLGDVEALAAYDDGRGPALYCGGAGGVVRWDGASREVLEVGGGGFAGARVLALQVYDDGSGPALYAGGWFTTAGGHPANHIARWDGESWTTLGSGTNNQVAALAVYDDGSGRRSTRADTSRPPAARPGATSRSGTARAGRGSGPERTPRSWP